MQATGFRLSPMKILMLLLLSAAVAVSVIRLFTGLGPVTNLSDNTPWGLWKAWDVVVYVPLGAAGFTMAFVRYFLKAERYEFIMRRSVVWAALCYTTAGLRLAFDIGLPWRLPQPIIFWGNIHSPLFEVAWCMFLYIVILFFENVPRLMERSGKPWILKLDHTLHAIMPFFVLGGVLLSVMHQSSLGTLFMIVGKRMDPLWYHPWFNYLFLLTAIAAGLGMTILIEGFAAKVYGIKFETTLLARLSIAIGVALTATLVWRVGSLAAAGSLGLIFAARQATFWWWSEMLIGYVVPLVIIGNGAWRNSRVMLLWAAGGAVLGMILFRMNALYTAMSESMNSSYFPSLAEWIFSIGFTAGTILGFMWLVETLPAMLSHSKHGGAHSDLPQTGD